MGNHNMLGSFRIHELLGTGATSLVFRGEHYSPSGARTDVAVKVMRSELTAPRSFRDNFMREVRSVARLNHPCIVKLYDAGEVGADDSPPRMEEIGPGSLYLVLELIEGGSLQEFARDLDFLGLKCLVLDLLDALAHAHAMGIVHRDLKPGNVLVEQTPRGPRVRLTDFGIARAHQDPEDASKVEERVAGTPRYMAPEQIVGRWREQGPCTDLYALGVMCWQLVSGQAPFDGETKEVLSGHVREPLPRFSPKMPVPPGFEAWLRKLLVKAPRGRFQRAADAAVGLISLPVSGVFGASSTEVATRHRVGFDEDLPTLAALGADASFDALAEPEPEGGRSWPAPPMPIGWKRLAEPRAMQLDGVGLGLYGLRVVPVVDRDVERSVLWSGLRAIRESGQPRGITLIGARGCGKTRLLDWLAVRGHELGSASVLRVRHSVRGSVADGLGPMLARATQTMGLVRADVEEHLRSVVSAMTHSSLGDVDVLADLIAPPEGETLLRSQRETFAALHRFVMGMAAERPVVLLLDDGQWGHEAVRFGAYVLDRESGPILVAAAFGGRDLDLSQSELGPDRAVQVHVDLLPVEHLETLVERLLGVSPALTHRIATRAEGNPLYAVELVGGWVDAGMLLNGATGFVLAPGSPSRLPLGLEGLWLERVDAVCDTLGPQATAARAAVEVAAVLGGEVDRSEWRLVVRSCGFELPPGLVDRLAAASLALDSPQGWRFSHGLIAETLYDSLRARPADLAALHAGCFRVLDFLQGRSTDPSHALRRAHHAAQSGASDAAFSAYDRATSLLVHRGDLKAFEACLDAQEELLDRIDAGVDSEHRLLVRAWRGRLAMYLGDFDRAIELAEDALERAVRVGARMTAGRASQLLAMFLSNRDPDRAAALYAQSARMYAELADDRRRGLVLCNAANLLPSMGRIDEAREGVDEAAHIAKRTKDKTLRIEVEFQRGAMARLVNDLPAARRHFESALEIAERLGWRARHADALAEYADVLRMLGELDEAERQMLRVLEVRTALGEEELGVVYVNLGLLMVQRGNYEGAQKLIGPKVVEFRDSGVDVFLQFALSTLMPALAGCERFEELRVVVDEYVDLSGRLGTLDPDLASVTFLTAGLCESAGEYGLAVAAYDLALAQYTGLERSDEATAVSQRLRDLGHIQKS